MAIALQAKNESFPVKLARKAIETYVRTGKKIDTPEDVPDFMMRRCGAFVSIKKRDKSLRGCIGTTHATRANLAEEIINNAISSVTQDPRFEPIREDELDDLVISVDALDEAEPVEDESHLDPSKYGVIVQSGFCKGLLLPCIDGVETVEDQVCIARQKAGLNGEEPCRLFRFTVKRYI